MPIPFGAAKIYSMHRRFSHIDKVDPIRAVKLRLVNLDVDTGVAFIASDLGWSGAGTFLAHKQCSL